MKTVILDTNFLLIPHQFKINVLEELEKLIQGPHELVVSTPIVAELKGMARERSKRGVAARVALEGITRRKIRIIEGGEGRADAWIVEYCKMHPGTIVCTNDILLKKELKGLRARVIVMRTRTRIFWD